MNKTQKNSKFINTQKLHLYLEIFKNMQHKISYLTSKLSETNFQLASQLSLRPIKKSMQILEVMNSDHDNEYI